MRANSILAVASLGLGIAASGASAAVLIPASSFVQPNIAMFNTPSLNFTAPAVYTESGATFRAGVPGGACFCSSASSIWLPRRRSFPRDYSMFRSQDRKSVSVSWAIQPRRRSQIPRHGR
jgi:hypothetical protein